MKNDDNDIIIIIMIIIFLGLAFINIIQDYTMQKEHQELKQLIKTELNYEKN